MPERDVLLYLEDIRTSIEKIERYTQGFTSDAFARDQKTVDAVIRNLEIIGEAARNIPSEVKSKHSDVPWDKMTTMRHKVVHEYFGVDEEILWQTVKEDLPTLKNQIIEVLKKTGYHTLTEKP